MAHEAETVRRVVQLVATAKSGKEKKRPIKVVDSSGAVKKVVPHIEVIDALLHHEGVSNEGAQRPTAIACEVCSAVVRVSPVGTVPTRCKKHPRSMDATRAPRPCSECGAAYVTGRSKTGKCHGCLTKAQMASIPDDVRRTRAALARSSVSEEAFRAGRVKFNATIANIDIDERRRRAAAAVAAVRALSPEAKSARMKKAWVTRRKSAQA